MLIWCFINESFPGKSPLQSKHFNWSLLTSPSTRLGGFILILWHKSKCLLIEELVFRTLEQWSHPRYPCFACWWSLTCIGAGNSSSHSQHLKGPPCSSLGLIPVLSVSPCFFFLWTYSWPICVALKSHRSHLYRSPSCTTFLWRVKYSRFFVMNSQDSHLYRTPSCSFLMWFLRTSSRLVLKSQKEQPLKSQDQRMKSQANDSDPNLEVKVKVEEAPE